MNSVAVPKILTDSPNWVVWKHETRHGKLTKVPYDAKQNGNHAFAKSNDPATWSTFQQALDATSVLSGSDYDGVGFMLQGTDLVGVDFDGVLTDGKPEPYVLEILKALGNPYCEITPSGNGLRAFVQCSALPPGNRKFNAKKKGVEKYGAEIYAGNEGGRYLTLTGRKFSGDGVPKIDNISLSYFLISKFPDEHFRRLWLGDSSDYENDDSRADFALAGTIARFLNRDRQKVEAFFNASIPGHREKWLNREDYRDLTLGKLCAVTQTPDYTKTGDKNPAPEEVQFHLPAIAATSTKREYVIAPLPGQKCGWFPIGGVSLIGAPSGGSKTTLMYQMLLAQNKHVEFLGHETFGLPFVVMGVDRGEDDHKETMERMGFSLDAIPFVPLPSKIFDTAMAQVIANGIEEQPAGLKLVYLEGVDMMVTQASDIVTVSSFMHDLQQIAQHFRIAIIASGGSPKIKKGNEYVLSRDNFFGSVGWGRTASTMLQMQGVRGQKGRRTLHVESRNAAEEDFTFEFQDGVLVQIPNEPEDDGTVSDGLRSIEADIRWYKERAQLAKTDPSKKWFTRLDFQHERNYSESTAGKHVAHAQTKKHITQKCGKRKGQGRAAEYRWNESKTNPLWVEQQTQQAEEQINAF